MRSMGIVLSRPRVDGLGQVVSVLGEWQCEEAPLQLHPGDVGWFWRFGAQATAAAVRTWSRDGRIVAVGLLDGPDLARLTTAPEVFRDEELARRIAGDLADPERGVLPAGKVYVEAPTGALVRDVLSEAGWATDAPWAPLRFDLTEPVKDPGVRIEVTGPGRAHVRTAVHRASFGSQKFTDDKWHAMAAGPAYAEARCLVAHDDQDNAVAAVTVWSAGPGRPGLLEPMGAHPDHRGRGHGRAICVAAAAELQRLGASSALVCTPKSNTAGTATYESAGFRRLPERLDLARGA